MKKLFSITFGFVAAIAMAMSFCFAGCTKLFSFNGSFSQDEITLDIGEEFSPKDFFSSEKDVEFFSENENIVKKNDTDLFSALKSGKTALIAKSGDLIIDTMRVYVKYSFQTPTNIKISNDGLISWDSSAIVLDGKTVKPTYKVSLNGIEYNAPTNQYQIANSGEYTVAVRANSTSLVNASQYSSEISFVFDSVTGASGITFVSDDVFGSQSGVLSWVGDGDAVLTIGNIEQDVDGNEKTLNFSSYNENSSVDAQLKLSRDGFVSKTSTKKITKLFTQEPSIKNNEVYWIASNSIKHTLIRAVNVVTGETRVVSAASNTSVLNGLGEGIYTISNQAIGLEGYANGNVKDFNYQIGKVKNVDAQCQLEGTTLKVTFTTESEYNKNFVVKQNNVAYNFEFTDEKNDGKYTLTHDFSLDVGMNTFTIQAIPTLGGGEFEYGGKTTKLAIKSDEEKIFSAYNIEQVGEVSHSTDEHENSILTFNSIEYANSYQITINGIPDTEIKTSIGESSTTINLGKITKAKYGNTQQFDIEITAARVAAENEIVSPSVKHKILNMLAKPTMQNCDGGQNTDNNERYSWQQDSNATFTYKLYTTDETYSVAGIEPFAENVTNATTKVLSAGYYVIKVRALPIDENNFLASEEWGEDKFYYTEQIQASEIRLDYVSGLSSEYSGYVVKIKTVEFGYRYEILFGGDEINLGSVYNTNFEIEELLFNLPASAVLSNTKVIKVKASAKDEALQAIHSEAESQLTVEKLAAPSRYSVTADGRVVVENADSNAVLKIYKNGNKIAESAAGADAEADISAYDGEFTIQARSEGYDEFDGYTTNGTTKISSDFAAFVLHRSQTPFNLVYNSGVVSFEHGDRAEKYVVTIKVDSDNGTIQTTFDASISESGNKKMFNLENEIAALREENAEFNSIFAQKTQITLSVYGYISEEIDGVYYLPSFNATAKYNSEQSKIVIAKLDLVELEYDYDKKVIYWDGDESLNPVYEIYLNDERVETITTKAASGKYEYDISGCDFSKAGEYGFYAIVSSDNTLASDESKNIVIRKISQVQKLDVIEKADGYYAKFAFAAGDEGHIDDVIINGESNGANSEFKLNADSFSIIIKGENYVEASGDKIYYISSEASTFNIAQLQLNEFDADSTIEGDAISWQDYASSNANAWALTMPEKNLKYMVEIYSGATLKATVSNIDTNSLSLANEKLISLVKGDYTYKIYAYISEYEISNGGSGYYGKILLEENSPIKKLASVKNLKIDVDDTAGTIAEELAKDVVLSWEFDGTSSSSVLFEIYINGQLKATTSAKTYTFSQTDFGEEENTISVVAISSTDIHADKVEIKISRYAQPKISVDDRGKLTITDKDTPAVSSGYIIEITMNDKEGNSQTNEYYTKSREYDLNALNAGINQRSGDMKIRVIQRVCDSATYALPTIAAEATKIVLETPTISQTASGFIISSHDDGVTYYVKCEAKGYDEKVEGSIFAYPDEWEGGTYSLVIYAQRAESIDSWKNKPVSVEVSRVAVASEVLFELADNYLDYTISWDDITDASEYEIEVFKNDIKIGNTLNIDSASVCISEIRRAATDFKYGEYVISLRSLTDYASTSKTNSLPFKFKVTVSENTVDNVEVDEDGKLSFESNNKEDFFVVTRQTDSEEWFGQQVSAVTEKYIVPKYVGQLEISIVQINNTISQQTATSAQGAVINGAAKVVNATKLQDLKSVGLNENSGKITINVNVEATEADREFRVIHDGVERKLDVVKNKNSYEFLAIDMVNLFDNLNNGDFNFEIISIVEGYLRSNAYSGKIGYSNHDNTSTAVKQDEANDYIILTGDLVDGTTTVDGSSVSAYATAVHIVTNNKGKESYYCKTPVFGYWVEDSNPDVEIPNYFSATKIVGTNIKSTRCCAVNISTLLENYNAGDVTVKIGLISMQGELFTVTNYSGIYVYQKLAAVGAFNIHEGNFTWTNANEGNTAYMLYFDGEETSKVVKVSASEATYYLGENLDMNEEFTAGIKVVSSTLQTVPSKITNYMSGDKIASISQLAEVQSDISLTDGVLSLEFNTSSTDASSIDAGEGKYSSIEAMLAALNTGGTGTSGSFPSITSFCQQLITNRMTQPFCFRLYDTENVELNLENIEFNLKFVKTLSNGTKKIYYTSVKAINILTRLSETTLAAIKEIFSDSSITSPTTQQNLKNVYRVLTNIDYFSGVASSSLLFREIGSGESGEFDIYPATKIPADTYDVYIQQIGSAKDNTISSQYKLAKANVKVENSPMTRVASEKVEGSDTNVYYAKFNPIDGKTNYKMVLRDKVTQHIVEYTISESDGKYYRSTFDGTTIELRKEGGFVWIPMNGESGVIYDKDVKDIHGYDLTVKEIRRKDANGSSNISSGTTYGGVDGNITINGVEYTYTVKDGAVSISGATIVDGKLTIGEIVYSVSPVLLSGSDFTVDIYAVGDETTLNGMSEPITVTFLKFNIDTLELKNGKFVWENFTVNSKTYSSTVITQRVNTTATVENSVAGAQASFTPAEQGAYQKFKFLTKGEASGFEIKVDSDVYVIENLYKLNRPNIQISNGIMIITDNTASQDTRTEKNFILSNDKSEKQKELIKQTYIADALKNGSVFSIEWQTGVNGMTESEDADLYQYRLTEQTATRFDAAVSGESFTKSDFVVTGVEIGTSKGYYTISIADKSTPILLQSERTNAAAAKLAYTSINNVGDDVPEENKNPEGEIKLVNGNIVWTKSQQSVAEDMIDEITTRKDGDLEILYEVTIDFYYETSGGWNKHSSAVYYTSSNSISSEQIVDPVNGEEFRYVIKVCANVYAYTTNTVGADITTIENISYKKITNKTYSQSKDVSRYILSGEILTLGSGDEDNLVARTVLIEDFEIAADAKSENAGKLRWKHEGLGVEFKVYAISGGIKTELKGEVKRTVSNTYVFDIYPGQLSISKLYDFEIIAYEVEKNAAKDATGEEVAEDSPEKYPSPRVASNGQRLFGSEVVKILPNVSSSDYEVELGKDGNGNSTNVISFSEYFSSHKEEYGVDIQIRIYDESISGSNKYNYVSSDYPCNDETESILVRAIPTKENGKYLMSDSDFEIKLESVDWTKYDDYYYDSTSQTLHWTFGVTEQYSITNEEGVEIYLKTTKDDKDTYYPFGVVQGSPMEANDIMLQEKIEIEYFDTNGDKVDGAYVYLDAINIEAGEAIAVDEQPVDVYVGDEPISQLEIGQKYQLTQTAFAIKNVLNPYLTVAEEYYLPINVLIYKFETVENTGGTIRSATAAFDSAYFTDADCTQKFVVKDVVYSNLEGCEGGLNEWENNKDYQKVVLDKKNGNSITQTIYYLKTTELLRELVQDESRLDEEGKEEDWVCGVTFKISFTTQYGYNGYSSNGAISEKYEVKDYREYKNVPIGEVLNDEFAGIKIGEGGIRVTSFQFPRMGSVSGVEICARKTENNLLSDPLLQTEDAQGKINNQLADETFEINLFNFGEGTMSDPYIINSAEEFENMKYRSEKAEYMLNYHKKQDVTKRYGKGYNSISNTHSDENIKETNKTYYFKQNNTLILETNGFLIDETFNGVYDGNGKSIKVNVSAIESLDKSDYVTTALPVSSGYDSSQEFTLGAGVFKTLGANGVVKNVNLEFATIVDASLSESIGKEKALISGLIFKNLGIVDSVTVTSSEVVFDSALQQSGTLAVAPVIGENRYNATNLVSNADVEIKNAKKSSGSQHFYYGGIVGFHNAGTLLCSKSMSSSGTGSVNVSFSSNSNGTVAVGGIAIATRSTIDIALNTKNISASCSNGSSFAGGVVALGVNSTLYSCVNTANISASYAGGIAYAFYNTKVSTLVGLGTVNNAVQNLFAKTMSFASASTSERVYTYSTYKPSGSFTVTVLSGSANIKCKNRPTYTIAITVASGVYSADIVSA